MSVAPLVFFPVSHLPVTFLTFIIHIFRTNRAIATDTIVILPQNCMELQGI
jgi:hypothetical protein